MHTHEDLTDASNSEFLIRQGWRMWSKDELFQGKMLLLCPLADFANVPDGTVMHSITGDSKVKGKDEIDDDARGGLMAYGVLLEKVNVPDEKKKYRSIDDT